MTKADRKSIGDDIQTVQYGWPIGMPLVDSIEKGIWEVRTKLDKRIARVLFTPYESQLVLLHGFIKKTQTTPKADKELTRNRLKDMQRRSRKNEK
ncbi:MAG: type II toxin-antitoxin system RelE/ParE family toxin [Mariprofundaceae bacterium]|nr:type II toxin-antitoxin system RelE/ParE family toxin [Mariprofundaceae bacterium]